MESLLVEKEVLSLKTGLLLKNVITFDQTVGSCSNNYSGFWRPVSLYYIWKPYYLKRRSCGARPE